MKSFAAPDQGHKTFFFLQQILKTIGASAKKPGTQEPDEPFF
jgi:hypothetical protein